MELVIQVVRYLGDDPQPGIVACEFLDSDGRTHTLVDKVPIFSAPSLDAHSSYPQTASVTCEVMDRWTDEHGRELVRITTAKPYDIESTDGSSEFVVLASQLQPA